MALARVNYVVGPAKLVRSTGICFTKANFAVRLDKAMTPVVVDAYGQIDERDEDIIVKADFVPEGRWNSATRSFLWPYLNPTIGSDLFGTSDTPCLIHDSNSHLHTIIASAVTKMPSIKLSAKETMIGSAEISGVRSSTKGWADAASLYTVAASGGTLTDTGFSTDLIKIQTYVGVWTGITGFTTITTEQGWEIDFNTELHWVKCDDIGTVKATLKSVSVMAKCIPIGTPAASVAATDQVNLDAAQYIQVTGGARGRSLNANGADLVITGADGTTIITIKNAGLVRAGYRFGSDVLRQGEFGWVATRSFATGVAGALCTLA